MSITYTPATNFGAKDSLPTNDPDKVIKGSEFSTEFVAIQTAFGLAAPAASPTFTGTVTIASVDINGGAIDGTTIGSTTPAAGTFSSLTATTADINGGTIDGVTIGGSSAGAITGTTITGTSFVSSGDMTFGDNDKAIFGAGSDLQIYHTGSGSFISDQGSGPLNILTSGFNVINPGNTETLIDAVENGAVQLYYDNAAKLSTTSTGIDVTGTVVSNGLTLQNNAEYLKVTNSSGASTRAFGVNAANNLYIGGIDADIGPILFVDNGATLATLDPTGLDVTGTVTADGLTVSAPSGDTPASIVTTTAGAFLSIADGNTTSGRAPLLGTLTDDLVFYTNGGSYSEKVRIAASGNVGIGTSSPNVSGYDSNATALTVSGTNRGLLELRGATGANSTQLGAIRFLAGSTSEADIICELDGSGNGFLTFDTNGSEAMRIDSSGNLGLGVTPSAWNSSYKGLQMNGGALQAFTSGDRFAVNQNVFVNTSGVSEYVSNGYASQYLQLNSEHRFYTAPSGTAGNAISFTQAMTLDASGNLGIGTSSPHASVNYKTLSIYGSTGGGGQIALGQGSTTHSYLYSSGSAPFVFYNQIGGSEAARIDSSGNLLVGTTGAISGTNAAKQYIYGNTASQSCLQVTAGSSHTGIYALGAFSTVASASGSDVGLVVQSGNGSTVSSSNFFVYTNGDVKNTNNSYGAISDAKLKENITDASPKLDKLNQVRIVNYNLIGDDRKQLGVIAQELEQVFPGMVDETPDRDADGNDLGTTTKSVKYSVFVPMLIKAMQEQQEIINDLRARVAQLEGA